MADHWDGETPKRSLASLTQEVRAKLLEEYAHLIDAAKFTADEVEVLVHILKHAGCGEDGSFFLPDFAILWGGRESYIPKMELPPERVAAAVKILRRRGVLRVVDAEPVLGEETQRAASVVDKTVLEKLASSK